MEDALRIRELRVAQFHEVGYDVLSAASMVSDSGFNNNGCLQLFRAFTSYRDNLPGL
jgi:hypothetical protein